MPMERQGEDALYSAVGALCREAISEAANGEISEAWALVGGAGRVADLIQSPRAVLSARESIDGLRAILRALDPEATIPCGSDTFMAFLREIKS